MKYLYTNACSMGNKQEELEATVQLENYDLIAIMEMSWDESHKWNRGLQALQEGQAGKEVWRCCSLYVKKLRVCEEFPLRNSREQVESLWVKIKEWTKKGHLVVCVHGGQLPHSGVRQTNQRRSVTGLGAHQSGRAH